jgi:hypothetical protein
MKKNLKKTFLWELTLTVLLLVLHPPAAPALMASIETPEAFLARVQGLLEGGDLSGYLEAFRAEIRAEERERLDMFFGQFKMDSVALRLAGRTTGEGEGPRLYLQAFFQNAHTAMMESWKLELDGREDGWIIARKEVLGNLTTLHKLRMPSDRFERARRVDIAHKDIRLSFRDAAVFYDSLPDFETALIVIGRGTVHFSPSDAGEKHQMELLYKKKHLEDAVEHLYIRCSPSFFANNVKIDRTGEGAAVSPAEQAKAASVFARNYPRSFTIENSLDGERLSFLPQGDEAVLEFKARKAGELTYIYHPFSEATVNLYDRGKKRVISLYDPDGGEETREKRFFVSFEDKFDVESCELDLSFTPDQYYLSAKARIGVTARVGTLEVLKLRFSPDLEILKILDGEKRELFFTQDKLRRNLYVYLLEPPGKGGTAFVEVFYRGRMVPPVPSTDVIGQAGSGDRYIFRPRYETYFYSHAGDWYPGPTDEDYFLARLKIVVPPGYKCVANGEMVDQGRRTGMDDAVEIEKAGSTVYTFETRRPVKYLSFIVGKFDRQRDLPGPIPVTMSVSSEIMDARLELADRARDILDQYQRWFGAYPYEKLGIVLRLWPTYGGHSPASFVVLNQIPWMGEAGIPPGVDSPVDLSQWPDYFLAHEIAHQWWGQGVSFTTYKDQWLSEGLAQFAAASFLREKYGDRAFASILKKFSRWTRKKSFRGPILMGSRLSYFDFDAYQSILYNKSALALFMLEDLVGRDLFLRGLQAFFEKYRYRPARTASFIAEMEAASGRDLKAFFHGWFSSHELPDVRTSWTETPVADGVRVTLRVTQMKGPFVFPLWIEWTSDRETFREMVIVEEASQEFLLTLPAKPDKVRINPLQAVPGKFH